MGIDSDNIDARKRLTFEQAEGRAPLPTQLRLREVSPELRAVLWTVIYSSLDKCTEYSTLIEESYITDPWNRILRWLHVFRHHRMIDEFPDDSAEHIKSIKHIFKAGDYADIFGWLQDVLRQNPPFDLDAKIDAALMKCRCPYRVVDKTTIVPISSDQEMETINRAFADVENVEFDGAKAHLRRSAELLTSGEWNGSVRESIHAVESVARKIDGSGKFGVALTQLSESTEMHASMKTAFLKLYGYTSDEQGIRHPLLDGESAAVDEHDAVFMLGACAAFVSFLVNKARKAGMC